MSTALFANTTALHATITPSSVGYMCDVMLFHLLLTWLDDISGNREFTGFLLFLSDFGSFFLGVLGLPLGPRGLRQSPRGPRSHWRRFWSDVILVVSGCQHLVSQGVLDLVRPGYPTGLHHVDIGLTGYPWDAAP